MTENSDLKLPVLTLRAPVAFPVPSILLPVIVSRPQSVAACRRACAAKERSLFVAAQKEPEKDLPEAADLAPVGVFGGIHDYIEVSDGLKVLLWTSERAIAGEIKEDNGLFSASRFASIEVGESPELMELLLRLRIRFAEHPLGAAAIDHQLWNRSDIVALAESLSTGGELTDLVAYFSDFPHAMKLQLLQEFDPCLRCRMQLEFFEAED